jgi:tetratricopeptide (TPR) repeat protein
MKLLAVLGLAIACEGVGGCARDPAQVAWDQAYESALREGSEDALLSLARRAQRSVDAGEAELEAARLMALRDPLAAARLYQDISARALRKPVRARAHYQLARMAEDRGQMLSAVAIYRGLVTHYPNLMPGERSLAHLLRIAREEGDLAVDEHLAWTRSLAETLAHTELADNLLMQAADEAKRRAERDARDNLTHPLWQTARSLFERVAREHPGAGLWNDALWELSLLHHQAGDYRNEIALLEQILRERSEVSLFGQNEHPYFYLGLRRVARLYHVELDDPVSAAKTWLLYAERYEKSILRDDVRFFALCAELRAGRTEEARALETLFRAEHPDSKYLRRLPLLSDPRGPHCLPPEVQ